PHHDILIYPLSLADVDELLFPHWLLTGAAPNTPRLARDVDDVHRDDVDLERLRDRVGDVTLGGVLRDGEDVAAAVRFAHRALRDDRPQKHRAPFDRHD